mmetsp:Transcript_15721/g.22053  ORF Transcript_15721/g.22053 Transcript_15721/m.22053 type:complete len:227 (-) Transcript_15721:470-1150(-)
MFLRKKFNVKNKIKVFWHSSGVCPGDFLEVFQPIDELDFFNDRDELQRILVGSKPGTFVFVDHFAPVQTLFPIFSPIQGVQHPIYENITFIGAAPKWSHKKDLLAYENDGPWNEIVKDYAGLTYDDADITEEYAKFKPTKEEQTEIIRIAVEQKIMERVGVHIRHTDLQRGNLPSINSNKHFIDVMNQEIKNNSRTKFYLATDSPEAQWKFMEKYGFELTRLPSPR